MAGGEGEGAFSLEKSSRRGLYMTGDVWGAGRWHWQRVQCDPALARAYPQSIPRARYRPHLIEHPALLRRPARAPCRAAHNRPRHTTPRIRPWSPDSVHPALGLFCGIIRTSTKPCAAASCARARASRVDHTCARRGQQMLFILLDLQQHASLPRARSSPSRSLRVSLCSSSSPPPPSSSVLLPSHCRV